MKKDLKRKIKNIYKETLKFVKNKYHKFRKNPKKEIINFILFCKEAVKNNVLFFVFVISLLFNTVLLRFVTIHTWDNVLFYKPLLSDLTVILVFGGLSYLVREKHRFKFLLCSSIFLTLICIINSCYYTFYTSFASISLLSTTKYLGEVGDALFENVLRIVDLSYIWAPIILIFVNSHLKRKNRKRDLNKRDNKKASCVFTAAVCTALIVIFTLTSLEIGRLSKQWNREYIVMRFGIYVYHINDAIKSIEPTITSFFGYDDAMKKFNDYYSDVPDTQYWTNEYTGIFKDKNVLVIHAESIQNFVIGLKFNDELVAPNLTKLAEKSLYFSNFYSQVSTGTSSDAEFTFDTSLMPAQNGTAFGSYFNREYVALPKLMQDNGYYTFSMHGNNGAFWNRDIMYQSLGYDYFYSKGEYDIDEKIGLGLSDKSFFRQSIEKLKTIREENKKYYGKLIMLSNHTPFSDLDKYGEFDVDIKEEIVNELGETEVISHPYLEGTKLGNYLKSVHYADSALGEFLDALEENGFMDDTVIVLYGDHDARLGKSEFTRLYNYSTDIDDVISSEDPDYFKIDTYQYDIIRKVPFIIYSKETEKKFHKEIKDVMGMYDVFPTLGNMFGLYNKYSLGHDIFSVGSDNIVVFPSGNFVTNKVFYNSQKGAYITLNDDEISSNYISDNIEYCDKLLNVSNSLIVYDLIKQERLLKESNEDYIEERNIQE